MLAYHAGSEDFIIHVKENELQDITHDEMLEHIEETKERQIQINIDIAKNQKHAIIAKAQKMRQGVHKNIQQLRAQKYSY
jgi:C-terminal processing protease CtpA/Prc